MLRLKRSSPHAVALIQLLRNQLLHSLARASNDLLWTRRRLKHPPNRQCRLSLAILAQKGRVDNDAVKGALEGCGKLERLGEIVKDEFVGEDGEAVVVLEQGQLGLGLVGVGVTVQEVLELDEDGGGGDDGDGGGWSGAREELFGEEGGCFVGVLMIILVSVGSDVKNENVYKNPPRTDSHSNPQ